MATASPPELHNIELPIPKVQDVTLTYRGGSLTMADGTTRHDLVDLSPRHTIRVRWEYLSDTDLATIKTAYDSIKDNTLFYQSIEGDIYDVTRPEGGGIAITTVVVAGGELRYHAEFEMIENDVDA